MKFLLLSYKPKNSPYQRRNTRGKHRFQGSSNPSIRVWSGCRIFAQAHRCQFLQGNRKHALRRAAQCKIPLRKSDSQHNRRSYAYIPYCMKYFPVRQYFILSSHDLFFPHQINSPPLVREVGDCFCLFSLLFFCKNFYFFLFVYLSSARAAYTTITAIKPRTTTFKICVKISAIFSPINRQTKSHTKQMP